MALKTNYKDDGFTGNRKYRQITNPDNTVSFEDVTAYNPVGDSFGAKDINDTNIEINNIVNPTFEDYTGSATVPDPETALAAIKSKAGITTLFSNIKAVLKGVLLKKYLLTTKEQIMANTLAGRTADALVVKEINSDLTALPTVKTGITEVTFSGGNVVLSHNAGFPDTNYIVMFICDNVRMFPRMCTNIDGNKTTLSASFVNGSGAIAHLEGKYRVMWIVARSF